MKTKLIQLLVAAAFTAAGLTASGQTNDHHKRYAPPPDDLPADGIIEIGDEPPPYPFIPAALLNLTSPPPAQSFQAVLDTVGQPYNDESFPPDVAGAVGPNHLMTMLNTDVRIQDRLGHTNLTISLSNWWGFTFQDVGDTRVIYDPY